MKLSIVTADGVVCVDGVCHKGLDLTGLDSSYRAIQWDETSGEIEVVDSNGKALNSVPIDSIDQFLPYIALWQAKKEEIEAAEAAELAAEEARIEQERLDRESMEADDALRALNAPAAEGM